MKSKLKHSDIIQTRKTRRNCIYTQSCYQGNEEHDIYIQVSAVGRQGRTVPRSRHPSPGPSSLPPHTLSSTPQSNNLSQRTQCTRTLAKTGQNAIKHNIHQGNISYLVSQLNKRIKVHSNAHAICQPSDLRFQLATKNQPMVAQLASQLTTQPSK
jgi:hypothetical protein